MSNVNFSPTALGEGEGRGRGRGREGRGGEGRGEEGRGWEGRGGDTNKKIVTLDKNQPIKIFVCSLLTLSNVHYCVPTLNIFNSKFI